MAPKPLRVVRKRSGRRPLTLAMDSYNALTLALEECRVLVDHVVDHLEDIAFDQDDGDELYALALVTRHLRDKQQQVHQHADALLEQARGRTA